MTWKRNSLKHTETTNRNDADQHNISAINSGNQITVGVNGKFTTLKSAVDWFNASATSNTDILVDAGNHNITDTIVVNNGSYFLSIKGLGTAVTFLKASTGLTNKPMFDIRSRCDMTKISLVGSTLGSYGTLSTENAINYTTTNAISSELTDIFFDTFYVGINDIIGANIYLFYATCKNITSAGVRINTSNSNSTLGCPTVIFENCNIGIDLLKANNGSFFINTCFFLHYSGSQIAIKYTGGAGNYVYSGIATISDCTYNNTGIFLSGFDFTRSDGRDANIIVVNNPGTENKNPHCKVNVLDNATATTITNINTWYKANLTLTSRIVFDNTATAGNFTITIDGETTGNIAYNASVATIKSAIEALSIITTVTVTEIVASKEWTIRFDTANEGWLPMSVNISGLTTTTSYYITGNTYITKLKVESNRVTWLQNNISDVEMFINCNLLCSRNSVRIDLAIARYNSSNVFKGYYAVSTITASASATTNPVSCPLFAYISEVANGDYFEIHIQKPTNAGDTVTLSDVNWLVESK